MDNARLAKNTNATSKDTLCSLAKAVVNTIASMPASFPAFHQYLLSAPMNLPRAELPSFNTIDSIKSLVASARHTSPASRMSNTRHTLLWGTANPEGMQNYRGIYLNDEDIQDMIRQVESANSSAKRIPVHVEHKGVEVGHVVSAWRHAGKLECVLAIDNRVLEGSFGSEFVRSGICRDLSLGYDVSLEQSQAGVKVGRKHLKEISIVKRGARPSCHIHGVSS